MMLGRGDLKLARAKAFVSYERVSCKEKTLGFLATFEKARANKNQEESQISGTLRVPSNYPGAS